MQLTFTAFRRLRVAGVLLLSAIVAGSGLAYWSWFHQQESYFTSRNFRLLTALAEQTENLVDGHGKILQGALADDRTEDRYALRPRVSDWIKKVRPFVPTLRDLEFETPDERLPLKRAAVARYGIDFDEAKWWLTLAMHEKGSPGRKVLAARIRSDAFLEPLFAAKLEQGAFDTLAFATQDGQVVFATGRREHELQSTRLDALVGTGPKADKFQQTLETISRHDIVVAGVPYKMFVQPCCRSIGVLGSDGSGRSSGMLVAGLVESEALQTSALAVSPILVIGGIVLILMALVIWPFLKLMLLGERQSVSALDAVQLGACSVFGLALSTIVLITILGYARLNGDVKIQLEFLADALNANINTEMRDAYVQLTSLEQRFVKCRKGIYENVSHHGDCGGAENGRASVSTGEEPWQSSFETFSVLDAAGEQTVKAAPKTWVPSRINVSGRTYFDAVRDGRYWLGLPACSKPARAPDTSSSDGCILESLWSWTTGIPQAVLSKPTGLPKRPVAAISIPMRSLIKPVMPAGFEYAVINSAGMVLFHSDPHRNTHENFFTETDGNRRLRSVVAAHSSAAIGIPYWGRPHLAYVRPADVPGWSIVTLFDRRGTRAVILEWAAMSLLPLLAYLIVWVLVMVAALKVGATWMWPDSMRRSRYIGLCIAYAVAAGCFVVVLVTGGTNDVLVAGVAIPAIAWAVTFGVLRRRPAGLGALQPSDRPFSEYAVAGALFLVLTGIVPGIAFAAPSYGLHVESYVKYRQLRLARDLRELESDPDHVGALPDRRRLGEGAGLIARTIGRRCDKTTPDVSSTPGIYFAFFYDTCLEAGSGAAAEAVPGARAHRDFFLSLIDAYVPYFAETSVESRELLHTAADDRSWWSVRTPSGQLTTVTRYGADDVITLRSEIPSLLQASKTSDTASADHSRQHLVMMSVAAPVLLTAVVGLAYGIVTFILRHLFLSKVAVPLWASGHLVATAGDNLLVLCRSAMAEQIQGVRPLALGVVVDNTDPWEWRRVVMKMKSEAPGRAIIVTDLHTGLDDSERTHRKLLLLAELVKDPVLTVVVLSEEPPEVLADSVRPARETEDKELWGRVLQAFIVVDWRDRPAAAQGSSPLDLLLEQEGIASPAVAAICDDIRSSPEFRSGALTRDQILDEIEDCAASFYRRQWNTCSDEEKVVLGHVAQHGLANSASRRVVRRLLVRRLLIKDPDLRPMNRTFGRFILSTANRAEVVRLEGLAEPSTWDRLRAPLVLGSACAGLFLFTTQRETFDATVSVLAGVTSLVPTIVRAVSLLAQGRVPPGSFNA